MSWNIKIFPGGYLSSYQKGQMKRKTTLCVEIIITGLKKKKKIKRESERKSERKRKKRNVFLRLVTLRIISNVKILVKT